MAEPLRLDCQIPPALLFVQPTQQQVHPAVVLTVGMLESQTTQRTLAGSHNSCRHSPLSPLALAEATAPTLLAFRPDRKGVTKNRKLFLYSP